MPGPEWPGRGDAQLGTFSSLFSSLPVYEKLDNNTDHRGRRQSSLIHAHGVIALARDAVQGRGGGRHYEIVRESEPTFGARFAF